MSYEPTNWKTGDVVSSEKLNKLENGVANAGGLFVVHGSFNEQDNSTVLDCTTQELLDAINDGKIIIYSYVIKENSAVILAYQGTMNLFTYVPAITEQQSSQPARYEFSFVSDATGYRVDDINMSIPKVSGYVAYSLDEYPVMIEE